ncbi:hypothetical protein F6X40_35445 [Paraburkholderia sp. UCT31]|uniref:hypothetical protein n=1 Tax=Paraburkholderia sp. UCT31 TaxID=2615209 RepID=UPI001654E72C|nr:hypothetical protein [Paraburkholderia sp. UCT31]MBC8741845.1 hypothetical protein [Paraburkholderia sp. UCT31]
MDNAGGQASLSVPVAVHFFKQSPDTMSQSQDLTSETLVSLAGTIGDAAFQLGIHAGVDKAAKALRDKAGVAFASGNDTLARTLRDQAEQLDELAGRERRVYDSAGDEARTAAYAELGRRDASAEFSTGAAQRG